MKKFPLASLVLLFFGIATSLLAFTIGEVSPEKEQNNLRPASADGAADNTSEPEASGDTTTSVENANFSAARAPEGSLLPAENTAADSTQYNVVEQQTFFSNILEELQNQKLGNLIPDFLISNTEDQKKEYQEKYINTLIDLRVFSPKIANTIDKEELPKTEAELQAFQQKYEELAQKTTSEDEEKIALLNKSITQVYGLKAALNVLTIASEHRNRFLKERQNSSNSEINCFDYEGIDLVNQAIKNLQCASTSIQETTKQMITNSTNHSLTRENIVESVTTEGDLTPLVDRYFEYANLHAQKSIFLNTQYAETFRAGNPQLAEAFNQEAKKYSRQAELLYSVSDYLGCQIQARLNNNQLLDKQWDKAIRFSLGAAGAIEENNETTAALYSQAATYSKNAADAFLKNNLRLARLYDNAGTSFAKAARSHASQKDDADSLTTKAEAIRRRINQRRDVA